MFKEGEDLSTVLIAGALAAKWQEVRRRAGQWLEVVWK